MQSASLKDENTTWPVLQALYTENRGLDFVTREVLKQVSMREAAMVPGQDWSAGQWTAALERWPGAVGPRRVSGAAMEQAVALALVCGLQPRRPLLRWYLCWRHLQPRQTAQQLLDAGVPHGPELGQQLRSLRIEAIEAVEAVEGRVLKSIRPSGAKA